MITTKDLVNKAFRLLRKAGYYAKQNYWCCQSCAWSDVPEETEKVVFYHAQDNDAWNKDKELDYPLHLAWSGDGNEIVKIFESVGLNVEWNGKEEQRIAISQYQAHKYQ